MRRLAPLLLLASVSAEEPPLPPGAAAVVNGEAVPMADLQSLLLKRHGAEALQELVLKRIVDQEARRNGIEVGDAEIARRGEEARAEVKKQYPEGNVSLEDLLKAQGISEGDFREQVVARLTLEKLVIRDLLCGDWARLRLLTSSTEEKATEMLEKLKAGADFGELARKESTDRCAARDGDFGVCFRGEIPPELEAAAFPLGPGGLTGVVQTPAGFVIARVEERQQPKPRTWAEIRPEVESRLAGSPPPQEQVQRLLGRLQRAAKVRSALP